MPSRKEPASPLELNGRSLRDAIDDYQRSVIQQEFQRADGNWAATARALGMHRSNLHHLAKRLGLT
jgi:anaerobic nitric oxide reductase transcription regulator